MVRTLLPLQGAWVRSLVGELRSLMLRSVAKKIKKILKREVFDPFSRLAL